MANGRATSRDGYVGAKLPKWKREALKEVARQRRTDVSTLLRDHIDGLLDEHELDSPDALPPEIEV